MASYRTWLIAFGMFAAGGRASAAHADEQLRTTVTNGDWAAFEHHETMMSPADMCAASNFEGGFMLRHDSDGLEVRIIDKSWTLPTDVSGQVKITVGDFSAAYNIGSNTSEMVVSSVPETDYAGLFAAMDKGASMTVLVGKAKKSISLNGSTKVTNAFRTCSGLKGPSESPGANPFK